LQVPKYFCSKIGIAWYNPLRSSHMHTHGINGAMPRPTLLVASISPWKPGLHTGQFMWDLRWAKWH
jgi:hypothetical protein